MSPGEFQEEFRVAYGESLGDDLSLAQDRQLDGVTQGKGLTGELSQNIIPAGRDTLIGREEARRPRYFCTPGLDPKINLRVLTGSQALITTSDGGILINGHVWKFVIDQENLCTAKLNGFVRRKKRKPGRGYVPTRGCPSGLQGEHSARNRSCPGTLPWQP